MSAIPSPKSHSRAVEVLPADYAGQHTISNLAELGAGGGGCIIMSMSIIGFSEVWG